MFQLITRLWTPVEVRTTIPASREAVYEVLADPRTYPDWLVGAQKVRAVDPGFPAPGTAFHHEVGPSEDATVADKSVSLGADAPRRLELSVHVGPMSAKVEFLILPDPEGSEVRFREVPSGGWRALTPTVRLALRARNTESLRQLRNYVGARAASASPAGTTA